MELRSLGASSLRVSALGLGTVKIGRNVGVKYPGGEGFPLPTDEQVADLLATARDEGINVIDTAPAYGSSEERLGAIMRSKGWFGGREHWVVITKTGEEFDGSASTFDFTPEHTRRSVERSLQRLGCDVLDCVLIHSDGRDDEIMERMGTLEALYDLGQAGLLRTYGISTKTAAGAISAVRRLGADRTGGRGVIMATLNAQSSEDLPAIHAAGEKGVGVLIKKALGSGHLARSSEGIENGLRHVYTMGGAAVSSVIVGTSSGQHLRANAAAARRALGQASV